MNSWHTGTYLPSTRLRLGCHGCRKDAENCGTGTDALTTPLGFRTTDGKEGGENVVLGSVADTEKFNPAVRQGSAAIISIEVT